MPFLLGLFVVLAHTLSTTGWQLNHFPGDLGDARFNNYILEHAHRYFTGQEYAFWNAPFMYPEPDVISYSDNLLGAAPIYSVLRIVGADRELAFQLWYIAMALLSFTACFAFLNWYFKSKYAAVTGALIFVLSIALESQLTHAQTFPRFPIPLAFWMCFLFMKELQAKYFFAAILLVVYQFYCGIYLGFFLAVPIFCMLILSILFRWDKFTQVIRHIRWSVLILGSILLNIVLINPLISRYSDRAENIVPNTYEYVFDTLPSLQSFFHSKSGSLFWRFLNERVLPYRDPWDHQIFVGGIATTCLIAFLILLTVRIVQFRGLKSVQSGKPAMALGISAIIMALFFTKSEGFSFYYLLFDLPGYPSLRSLTRVINIELLYFAFAVAFVANVILKKYHTCRIPVFLLFTIIIIADNYIPGESRYRTPKELSLNRIQPLIDKMRPIPSGSVISYEPVANGSPSITLQLDGMLASQSLGLKCLNAYSSTSPIPYQSYWNRLDGAGRMEWLNSFGLTDGNVVVIN